MNKFQTFLRARRSVRRFKPEPVPASTIKRILETAVYAPSAHNLQPWRFALIQTKSAKDNLCAALTNKMRIDMKKEGAHQDEIGKRINTTLRRIHDAPVIILLCRDVTAVRVDDLEEKTMAVQSVALAGLQILLSAQAEGLDGNWICWPLYAQDSVRDALKLPAVWEPQGMFFLGHAVEKPGEKQPVLQDDMVIKI